MKHWQLLFDESEYPPDILALAAELRIQPLTALILQQRGIRSAEKATVFLDSEHYRPTLPTALPDLATAAKRLERAVQQNERMLIWGDLDVDGQASAAILSEALTRQKLDVRVHIHNWHSINRATLRQLCEDFHPQIVIACDTGTASPEVAADLRSAGIDYLILDHHDLADTLPDALAFINPKRLPDHHPLRTLPSTGITYLLAQELYHLLGQERFLDKLLDFVALGIVADAAELVHDARFLVQQGLGQIRASTRPGIVALIAIARLDQAHLTVEDIAFQLAPRMNAFARLDHPQKGFDLLTAKNREKALILAQQAESLNQKRRLLSRQILQSAHEQVASDRSLLDWSVLVLENPHWEGGVISAVASQLATAYQRPVVLLVSGEDGMARGTARSIGGYDIHAALKETSDLLLTLGGHAGAAGLSLHMDNLPAFRRRLSNALDDQMVEPPALTINAALTFDHLHLDLANELEKLSPFGNGNPRPLFMAKNVRKFRSAKHGITDQHRRLTLRDSEGRDAQFYWWNSADLPMPEGVIDLVFQIAPVYRDEQMQMQLTLIDWQQVEGGEIEADYQPTLIDCRQSLDLAAIREREPDLVIWAEGFSQPDSPGLPFSALEPAAALLIYTPPGSPDQLKRAIQRVKPERIYIHAAPVPFEQPAQLLPALIALLKAAQTHLRGRITITQLAERTAQPDSTIKLALQALGDNLELSWITGNTVRVEKIATPDTIEIPAALQKAMSETAAYRRYFARAELDNLIS